MKKLDWPVKAIEFELNEISPSSSNAIPQRIGGIPLLENEIKQILIGEERTESIPSGDYPREEFNIRNIKDRI